jgi:hypothetical protein
MLTTTTSAISKNLGAQVVVSAGGQAKRRSIDPATGHALLILSHAIEHLAEKFALDSGSFSTSRGDVEAIQLLMSLNRKIYMACPEAPTVGQWLMTGLHKLLGNSPNCERVHLQG